MAEEKGAKQGDEYQYSGDEFAEELHTELESQPSKKGGIGGIFKNKKVIIPIIVIIAIVVVAQFLGVGKKKQTETEVTKKTQMTEPQRTTTGVSDQLMSVTASMSQELETLKQQSQKNAEEINQLQQQLQSLQASMEQLGSNIAGLSNTVSSLKLQMQRLAVRRPVAKKRKVVAKKVRVYMPVYHIEAVVPGRAWLESKRGATMTVSVGDRLKGYGKVQKIDVARGMVITSSGRIIRYGRDDS